MRNANKPIVGSHVWGLILAIFILVAVLCAAPALSHDGLKGGGFSEEVPSSICIVKVSELPLREGASIYYGSGAFLSDRLVLTCYHNIRDYHKNTRGWKLEILTKRGNVLKQVQIGKVNVDQDLCLLLTEPGDVHTRAYVTNLTTVPEDLVTYGFDPEFMKAVRYEGKNAPDAPMLTVRKGYGPVWFQHRSKTVQGMSGGPVVDARTGDIVGVQTMSSRDRDGLSQAVLPTRIQSFLDRYKGPLGELD